MARILLLSTADALVDLPNYRDYERLINASRKDVFKNHIVTSNANEADIILFVGSSEPDFHDVRRHPYVMNFREKCFLFQSGDMIIPFLPGIYASIQKRWYFKQRMRSGFYLRVFGNQVIQYCPNISESPYLFSFMGAANNAFIRKCIFNIKHPRSLLIDTSPSRKNEENLNSSKSRTYRYFDSLRKSKFVLCPKGGGTSSFRIFETMKAGRVPVIISDQWVAPEGPDWHEFSLRVWEKDIKKMPGLLEKREDNAEKMGRLARQFWEQWFSEKVAFHRIIEWCIDIKSNRIMPESILHWTAYLQLFRPFHFRYNVLGKIKRTLISQRAR